MSVSPFQEIIDSIEVLLPEEQDYLIELIQKRRIEKRRSEIASNAAITLQAWEQGTAKQGTVSDLRTSLLADDSQ
jgi:hypothetical protein